MREQLETVIVEFDDQQGIGSITLDRPESLNAINEQMHNEVEAGLELLRERDEEADGVAVHVVTIEGAGDRAFCAGADIGGFSDGTPADFDPYVMQDALRDYPAPVVAKIDGYCLGGGFELALCCDFRLASESSRFGFPESDIGLLPGAGGIQYVSRLVSPAYAKKLAMLGDHVETAEAAKQGLVDEWYEDETFDAHVGEFVGALADQPPLALRAIKDSGNNAMELGLADGRKYDRRVFPTLQGTEDHQEGVKAFEDDDYEPTFEGK